MPEVLNEMAGDNACPYINNHHYPDRDHWQDQ
jgi:hypothetical protein